MADYSAQSGVMAVYDAFTDENKVDISQEIYRKWVDNFPLMAMLNKGTVSNYNFQCRKSNMIAQEYSNSATIVVATTASQTLTLSWDTDDTSGLSIAQTQSYIPKDTLFMNLGTQAIYRLTTATGITAGSSGTYKCISLSQAPAVQNAQSFLKVGQAADEGATIGTTVLTMTDRVENYTMITRTPIYITETMRASEQYYGSELERQRKDMYLDHMRKLEQAAWWSVKKDGGSAGGGYRTTDGIMRQVCGGVLSAGNSEDIAGTLTEANFDAALKTGMVRTNRPATEWAFFCGATVYNAINNFAKDRMETVPGTYDKYGMHVKGYMTPFGTLKIIYEPWFNTVGDGTVTTYDLCTGIGALLDMSQFEYVALAGNGVNRDTSVLTNRQANSADTYQEETLTEWGIRYTGHDGGYILYGITG